MALISDEWIKAHWMQYADWHPTIEIIQPGSKQTITIKDDQAMKEVVKIMREGNHGRTK